MKAPQAKPKHIALEAYESQHMVVPHGYKIGRAFYGSPYGLWKRTYGYDVKTTLLERLSETPEREVVAVNSIWGDPLMFRYKVLHVELYSGRFPRHEALERGNEGDDEDAYAAPQPGHLLIAQEGETMQIPAGANIIRAFYGDPNAHWDVERGYDVVEQVRKAAVENNGAVQASNSQFGDPLMFRYKELVVEIEAGACDELSFALEGAVVQGTVAGEVDAAPAAPNHWEMAPESVQIATVSAAAPEMNWPLEEAAAQGTMDLDGGARSSVASAPSNWGELQDGEGRVTQGRDTERVTRVTRKSAAAQRDGASTAFG